MNPAFWRGRRVFVTGHTGFKGSWLALWLKELGASVTGYALPPDTDPNLYTAARVRDGLRSFERDVRDPPAVAAALTEAAPELVIHMAAQSLVRRSYTEPAATYATNVMGTVHLLDAARQCPAVKAVLIVTSDKCYESRETSQAYREGDALGGHDPYSSSKGCAELVTQAYRRSFFEPGNHPVGLASARAGNVIGGGDWAEDRLVPDLVRAFASGRQAAIRNPTATRPWQHVLDPLAGYLLLLERLIGADPRYAAAWNFGPLNGEGRSVEWIADSMRRLWGPSAAWKLDAQPHPHEARDLRLDCSRAYEVLGWRPLLGAEDALAWTAEWYRAYYAEPGSAWRLCEAQIRRYQDRLAT